MVIRNLKKTPQKIHYQTILNPFRAVVSDDLKMLRFSSNFEASALELLEHIEYIYRQKIVLI